MRGTGISQADRLYAASLVTAEATVRALLSGSPDQVSLVAIGDNRSKQAKRWCERDRRRREEPCGFAAALGRRKSVAHNSTGPTSVSIDFMKWKRSCGPAGGQ